MLDSDSHDSNINSKPVVIIAIVVQQREGRESQREFCESGFWHGKIQRISGA